MRWKVALPGLLLLLAGSVAVMTLLRGDAPLPPPSSSSPTAATDRAAARASDVPGGPGGEAAITAARGSTAVPTVPAPSRTAATEPGLSGIVLDDLGAPIPGIVVYLRLVDSRLAGAEITCTDGEGYFVFRQAVGRCVLTVENDLLASHELTMALGEWRFVELRATQPCLVVEGQVRQGDGTVVGRIVRAKGGPLRAVAVEYTDESGHYQHVLPPGRYELSVASVTADIDPADMEGGGEDVPLAAPASSRFARCVLTLNAFTRRVRHDFELPSASLRITVLQSVDRRPVANALVQAAAGKLRRHAKTDAGGVAVMTEMTNGTWRVSVNTSPLTLAAAQDVDVDAADRTPRPVTLRVEPAGVIRLTARTVGGAVAPEGRFRVVDGVAFDGLASARFGLASQPDAVRLHLEGGGVLKPADPAALLEWMVPDGQSLLFTNVPPGHHELRCEDRIDEGGCTYAVCEPFRQAVDVSAGGTRTVEVTAPRRPWLEILIADPDSVAARVPFQVVGSRGPVVLSMSWGNPAIRSGPVVPGDYKVVVDAPTGRIEQTVTVGNVDVQHVVRLPGRAAGAEKPARPR